MTAWDRAYDRWEADCLDEWNAKYSDVLGEKTLGTDGSSCIEFAENGSAYPHGIGGTLHMSRAVTRWAG